MSIQVRDEKVYIKEGILPENTTIDVLINGSSIAIEGFETTQFPVTVPAGYECRALIKLVVVEASP